MKKCKSLFYFKSKLFLLTLVGFLNVTDAESASNDSHLYIHCGGGTPVQRNIMDFYICKDPVSLHTHRAMDYLYRETYGRLNKNVSKYLFLDQEIFVENINYIYFEKPDSELDSWNEYPDVRKRLSDRLVFLNHIDQNQKLDVLSKDLIPSVFGLKWENAFGSIIIKSGDNGEINVDFRTCSYGLNCHFCIFQGKLRKIGRGFISEIEWEGEKWTLRLTQVDATLTSKLIPPRQHDQNFNFPNPFCGNRGVVDAVFFPVSRY